MKITYPFTLYSYVNEDKDERSEDLVYIYMEDDDDGWWESRCNLDDEKEFVIKSDEDYDEAMVALESLTSYDLGGKNIFPSNFNEKLFSTGKAPYTFVDCEGEKSKCTMVAVPIQNLESILAEHFVKTFKNLQKEGLFENIKSFDLSLKENKLNIKLNENTITGPTIEELKQLEAQFYNLVSACEKEDFEYRSKYSNIYLVYLDSSDSEHSCWTDDDGNEYTRSDIDWDDDDNEVINGIPLDQFEGEGGTAVIDFPIYSLDKPREALKGKGRLVGVMCEYLSQEADPKSLFMSKLERNNFIKKFCNKYHLEPMFYVGSRNRGDIDWASEGVDICGEIWKNVWNSSGDGYYDDCEISGPFGVKYYSN